MQVDYTVAAAAEPPATPLGFMAQSTPQQQFPAGAGGDASGEVQTLLGVIIPGLPMSSSWRVLSPERAVLVDSIPNAATVPDLMVTLLPDRAFLTPEHAAILYYTANGTDWVLLGAIAPQKPSAMLRTGWGSVLDPGAAVQLAVSIEPMQVADPTPTPNPNPKTLNP